MQRNEWLGTSLVVRGRVHAALLVALCTLCLQQYNAKNQLNGLDKVAIDEYVRVQAVCVVYCWDGIVIYIPLI
jgi:hypothetical protein